MFDFVQFNLIFRDVQQEVYLVETDNAKGPPENSYGECGRIAPHSLLGRTELAILHFKEVKAREKEAASANRAEA